MNPWKPAVAAIAASLLLAGCVINTPEDNIVMLEVGVTFTAKVTGRARVQWSDGTSTHTETVDDSGTHRWSSMIGEDRYVAAITVVPVGNGSKVSCKIDKDDGGGQDPYTDKSSSPDKAAVCIIAGESDELQPPSATRITATASTITGGARYRTSTMDGVTFVDALGTGVTDSHQFTVLGPVHMIVVAQQPGDTVKCRISRTKDDTELDADVGLGLGAIATCTDFILSS